MNSLREIGAFVGTPNASLRAVADVVRFVSEDEPTSVRAIILALQKVTFSVEESIRPLYRRSRPIPQDVSKTDRNTDFIDLSQGHLLAFGEVNPVAAAAALLDFRCGAAIGGAVGTINADALIFVPGGPGGGHFEPVDPFPDLLETKSFDEAPDVVIPRARTLAVIAYPDYFPGVHDENSIRIVSKAIKAANPGWCGTFGPGVEGAFDVALGDPPSGDYDMSEMHLLQIAYRYYDALSPGVREHLITQLLARGRVHRPGASDTFTSRGTPDDWTRAGFLSPMGVHVRIGETENHVLMILTARYLTNQLLYQRDHDSVFDNRRNGAELGGPNCMDAILSLLRNILRDDFSEYNAKPYQTETRHALLNLCSYAYDHEVRLAARMVLDYVSAHMAVSSDDLRRLVPFRRRNEDDRVTRDDQGFMNVSLLETTFGADPSAQHFALLAGNTRIYEAKGWKIATNMREGNDAVMYALSDYRLPPSIHDLFVNDSHRRFFQRLHRRSQDNVNITGRNCDNHEIYAGSPSYLISAGGQFAAWAIFPGPVQLSAKLRQKNDQQLGVAVPTSFMPTTRPDCGDPTLARDLIQFGRFSDVEGVFNYGVAPDFACGPQVHVPDWCRMAMVKDSGTGFGAFKFVDRKSVNNGPGFYLAFFQDGNFAVMEAFDTWLHPDVSFEQFREGVFRENEGLTARGLRNNVRERYTTQNGTRVDFVIFDDGDRNGASVESIDATSSRDALADGFGGASAPDPTPFLTGSVMNSKEDGVIEITNLFLHTRMTLDMRDQRFPRRTSESGDVEQAGLRNEVWVNLAWKGPTEGDFFHPFNTMAAAAAAVAPGGVIKMMPGVG